MDFEVFFRLNNKELARYQFAVETPADIQAGFINALQAFRVQHQEVDLLADGMVMLIQKRARGAQAFLLAGTPKGALGRGERRAAGATLLIGTGDRLLQVTALTS